MEHATAWIKERFLFEISVQIPVFRVRQDIPEEDQKPHRPKRENNNEDRKSNLNNPNNSQKPFDFYDNIFKQTSNYRFFLSYKQA